MFEIPSCAGTAEGECAFFFNTVISYTIALVVFVYRFYFNGLENKQL